MQRIMAKLPASYTFTGNARQVLLGDIRSDVSYIRAKLEDLKDAK